MLAVSRVDRAVAWVVRSTVLFPASVLHPLPVTKVVTKALLISALHRQ